jgi:hypothetical protein
MLALQGIASRPPRMGNMGRQACGSGVFPGAGAVWR